MTVEEEPIVDELEASEGEEEWPTIHSIPGLELSQSQSSSDISKPKSNTTPVMEDVSDSSSLGELRFQDE